MGRARIFRVIDTMAESWNLLLLRKHSTHVLDRVGSARINCLEKVKRGLVRAAVQRTFESADGRGNGRMHIRKRSGSHAGRERGRVQFMVGMQDKSNIQRAFCG